MVVPELQENAKLIWMSEGKGKYFECAHEGMRYERKKKEGPQREFFI
jgi:hypothetical protein